MSWNDDTKDTIVVPPSQINAEATCANLPFGSPDWLIQLCSCQAALDVNRKVYQDYVRDFNEFQQQDQAYRQYLTAVTNHKNARVQYQLTNYDGVRWKSQCYPSETGNKPAKCADINPNYQSTCQQSEFTVTDSWLCRPASNGQTEEEDIKSGGGDCTQSGAIGDHLNQCVYKPEYIRQMMAQWDVQNPLPSAVPPPVQVAEMHLSNLMCCDQSIDQVTADQAKVGNMIQNCQLNLQSTLAANASSLPIAVQTFPPTLAPTPSSTPSSTASSLPWAQQHLTILIVGVVCLLVIVGAILYSRSSSSSSTSSSSSS